MQSEFCKTLNTTSENKMRCWCINEAPLTLGAEAWSGPIPLIYSARFFASFVLVSSRLQGGKFLAREWRWLVWCPSTCRNEVGDHSVSRKEHIDEQFLIETCGRCVIRKTHHLLVFHVEHWPEPRTFPLRPVVKVEPQPFNQTNAIYQGRADASGQQRWRMTSDGFAGGLGLGLGYLWSWWGSRAGRCRSRWSRRLLRFRLRCW